MASLSAPHRTSLIPGGGAGAGHVTQLRVRRTEGGSQVTLLTQAGQLSSWLVQGAGQEAGQEAGQGAEQVFSLELEAGPLTSLGSRHLASLSTAEVTRVRLHCAATGGRERDLWLEDGTECPVALELVEHLLVIGFRKKIQVWDLKECFYNFLFHLQPIVTSFSKTFFSIGRGSAK